MKKEVVSIYVDNKANVLTRVVSLYGRRGFNIDSLTVSATNDPDISRITVTFEGDNLTLHQIVSQTEKLEVVRSVKTLDGKRSFFRELLMVKVSAGKEMRKEIKRSWISTELRSSALLKRRWSWSLRELRKNWTHF